MRIYIDMATIGIRNKGFYTHTFSVTTFLNFVTWFWINLVNLSITDIVNSYTVIFVYTQLTEEEKILLVKGLSLEPQIFCGQQRKYFQVNYYSVTAYIVHKGAAESNKCHTKT